MNLINKNSKSPLLAKIKFEPTFFQVLWRFAFSLPLQGEAGGKDDFKFFFGGKFSKKKMASGTLAGRPLADGAYV